MEYYLVARDPETLEVKKVVKLEGADCKQFDLALPEKDHPYFQSAIDGNLFSGLSPSKGYKPPMSQTLPREQKTLEKEFPYRPDRVGLYSTPSRGKRDLPDLAALLTRPTATYETPTVITTRASPRLTPTVHSIPLPDLDDLVLFRSTKDGPRQMPIDQRPSLALTEDTDRDLDINKFPLLNDYSSVESKSHKNDIKTPMYDGLNYSIPDDDRPKRKSPSKPRRSSGDDSPLYLPVTKFLKNDEPDDTGNKVKRIRSNSPSISPPRQDRYGDGEDDCLPKKKKYASPPKQLEMNLLDHGEPIRYSTSPPRQSPPMKHKEGHNCCHHNCRTANRMTPPPSRHLQKRGIQYKGDLETTVDLYNFIQHYYKIGYKMTINNYDKRRLSYFVLENRVPAEMRVFLYMMLSEADKEIAGIEKDFEINEQSLNFVRPYKYLFDDLAERLDPDPEVWRQVGEWSFYIFTSYVARHKNLKFLQQIERRHFLVPLVHGYRQSVDALKSRGSSGQVTAEMKRVLRDIFRKYYERPYEHMGFKHGDGLNIYHIFQECSNNFKYACTFRPELWTPMFDDCLRSFSIEDPELKKALFGPPKLALPCADVQQVYRTLLYPEMTPNPLQVIDLYMLLKWRTIEFLLVSKFIALRDQTLLDLGKNTTDSTAFTHRFRNDILPMMHGLNLAEVARMDVIARILPEDNET